MKVANNFPVDAWYRACRRNGWMMMDLLLAMTLVILTVTAFLPVVSQVVRLDRNAQIKEALLRQAVSIEETLFQELTYSYDITAAPDKLGFKTPQGRKKGFIVYQETLFVRLSDGSSQPLTGGVGTMKGCRILVRPHGKEPIFSRKGRAIAVSLLLVEEESELSLPVTLVVTSLNEGNR